VGDKLTAHYTEQSYSTMPASTEPAIGIDLGTTFSVIAYLDSTGRPQTIVNFEGEALTPSVVFFDARVVLDGVTVAPIPKTRKLRTRSGPHSR
jgi:hypothetical protein